jgi:hypothetical protein
MKARIASATVTKKSILALLFSWITLLGFTYHTMAQGWTFTFQLAQSGPCGNTPLPVLPTFPNFGFPSKNQCESLRQTVLSISGSVSSYDNQGHYLGECKVFYTATACTGSDITTPGQVDPGDVSFDGQTEGKPFFTTHQSEAFEDWASDYKALLDSYGITSILGDKLTAHMIPLTGDKKADSAYKKLSMDFNPPVPVDSGVYVAGSRVANGMTEFLNKKIVIPDGSSPEDIKAQQERYQEQVQDQGYNNLTQMDPNNPAIFDGPSDNQQGKTNNAAIAEVAVDAIGDLIGTAVNTLVPEAELPSFISRFETNLATSTPTNIQNALNVLKGTGSIDDVRDPGQLVISSLINTCTVCKWIATPLKY